jgi:hypothetical protein
MPSMEHLRAQLSGKSILGPSNLEALPIFDDTTLGSSLWASVLFDSIDELRLLIFDTLEPWDNHMMDSEVPDHIICIALFREYLVGYYTIDGEYASVIPESRKKEFQDEVYLYHYWYWSYLFGDIASNNSNDMSDDIY